VIHELIATGFYIGKLKLAPGTLGTLLGIPVVYLASFNRWTILLALGIVFLVGLIASQRVITASGEEDPSPAFYSWNQPSNPISSDWDSSG